MAVIHILRSGEQLADITGQIVKADKCGKVYKVVSDLNEKRREQEHEKKKVEK